MRHRAGLEGVTHGRVVSDVTLETRNNDLEGSRSMDENSKVSHVEGASTLGKVFKARRVARMAFAPRSNEGWV